MAKPPVRNIPKAAPATLHEGIHKSCEFRDDATQLINFIEELEEDNKQMELEKEQEKEKEEERQKEAEKQKEGESQKEDQSGAVSVSFCQL